MPYNEIKRGVNATVTKTPIKDLNKKESNDKRGNETIDEEILKIIDDGNKQKVIGYPVISSA